MKIANTIIIAVLTFTAITSIAAETYKEAFEKGMAEYKSRKYKEAAVTLSEAAKLAGTPDEKFSSQSYQGYSLQRMYKYAEAAKLFNELSKVEKLSPAQRDKAFGNYLNTIYRAKKYVDIIAVAEKTIADDKASDAMKTSAVIAACKVSDKIKKYDDKIKWAKKLQEINPKGIWYNWSLIYQAQALRKQKKYKEAEDILSKDAIAKMHRYRQGDAYLERANIKNAEKKYKEAIIEYTAVYNIQHGKLYNKCSALVSIIDRLDYMSKPEEAEVWIGRIDSIKNKYWKAKAMKSYAKFLQKQNKLKEAKEKWEECKELGKWHRKEADKQIDAIDKKLEAK